MGPTARLLVATLAYGALHSALASRTAKDLAARYFGKARQRALYRPFYIAQATVATGALALYGQRLPTRTLYRVRGPATWLFRAGQAAAIAQVLLGIREIGLGRLTGVDNLGAWMRGDEPLAMPAAQGPELDESSGRLADGGPFRSCRHPLNFYAASVFWLTPHLTTRRLTFNAAATLYLVLGSMHEAARLRACYGARYAAYERSGVPFFLPRPTALVGRSRRRRQERLSAPKLLPMNAAASLDETR